MSKKNLLAAGKEAVMADKANLDRNTLAEKYGFANSGAFHDALVSLGWFGKIPPSRQPSYSGYTAKTESVKPAIDKSDTTRKSPTKGALSLRIESWLDDQDNHSEDKWTPETVEPFILNDSVAWNRKISQCGPEEIQAFEIWLGAPCTMSRRAEKAAAVAKAAAVILKPKCIATLRKAQAIALEFDAELAVSIQQLILKCVVSD